MALQQGTKPVQERSASRLTVGFISVGNQLEAPATARYRIDDTTNGARTQVLDWTDIPSPSPSQDIVITAEQNRILSESNREERRVVTVEATGTDGLEFRMPFVYQVINGPATD